MVYTHVCIGAGAVAVSNQHAAATHTIAFVQPMMDSEFPTFADNCPLRGRAHPRLPG